MTERGAFDEVVATLDRGAAEIEAGRCLDCDLLCSTCDGVCPNRAITTYFLDGGRIAASTPGSSPVSAAQTPQVAVLADLCNECGNCVTFCPTVGRPWRDKPRLYFNRGDFEAETDNAFMLLQIDGKPGIQGRFRGTTRQLVLAEPSQPQEVSDPDLAILHTLHRGMTDSMPHLPVVEAEASWIIDFGDSL